MKEVRVLEIKESVFADNDRQADNLRRELKKQGVFLMFNKIGVIEKD